MNHFRAVLTSSCLALCFPSLTAGDAPAQGAAKPKLRIAVLNFTDATVTMQASTSTVASYAPFALSAMLETDFAMMNGVDVVEREAVDAAFTEAKLGAGAITEADTAQMLGKTLSADIMIIGSLRSADGFVRVVPIIFYVKDGKQQKLAAIENAFDDLIALDEQLFAQMKQALKLDANAGGKAQDAGAQKHTVAVLDFRDYSPPQSGGPLGGSLADLLTLAMSQQHRYDLVDRTAIGKVLQEKKLELAGRLARQSISTLGKLVGAQLLVQGSYTRDKEHIRIDVKIVNPESSRVLFAAKEVGSEKDVKSMSAHLAGLIGDARIDLAPAREAEKIPPPVAEKPQSLEDVTEQLGKARKQLEEFLMKAYQQQPHWMVSYNIAEQHWTPETHQLLAAFRERFLKFSYLRPHDGDIRFRVGEALYDLDDFAHAADEFSAAQGAGFKADLAAFNLGKCRLHQGEYKEAVRILDAVQNSTSKLAPLAAYQIGLAYEAQGDLAKKRECIAHALTREPKLADLQLQQGRKLDVNYVDTFTRQRSIREYYFQAFDLNPTELRHFCYYADCNIRSGMKLDTYEQAKLLVANLKEQSERAKCTYLYFKVQHETDEWAANENRYRDTSETEDGDKDFRVSYAKGKIRHDPQNGRLLIGKDGSLIYKFKFPGCTKVLIDIEDAERVSAGPDNQRWLVLKEHNEKPKNTAVDFLEIRHFAPLDLSSCLAADGTVYVKIEAGPENDSAIYRICGIGLVR